MDLNKLRPVLGNLHWHVFEDYLKGQKQGYVTRLIAESNGTASDILRGRIRELDILLSLASKVLSK